MYQQLAPERIEWSAEKHRQLLIMRKKGVTTMLNLKARSFEEKLCLVDHPESIEESKKVPVIRLQQHKATDSIGEEHPNRVRRGRPDPLSPH